MGAKVPENESSREWKSARTFIPGSKRAGPFRSRERKFQGAKWPGSELARFLLADSLGANWPGSEKARYHFCVTCWLIQMSTTALSERMIDYPQKGCHGHVTSLNYGKQGVALTGRNNTGPLHAVPWWVMWHMFSVTENNNDKRQNRY